MNLCTELLKKFGKDVKATHNNCRLYSIDKKKEKRYYYYKEIPGITDGIKATVIMINPSEKNEETKKEANDIPDCTIKNLYEILKAKNTDDFIISSFEVVNLFPEKKSTPENIIKKDIIDNINKQILEYVINQAEIIIPAWGIEEKFNKNTKNLLEDIKKWCKNKKVLIVINRYPCHFSRQCTGKNRNPEFIKYKFD